MGQGRQGGQHQDQLSAHARSIVTSMAQPGMAFTGIAPSLRHAREGGGPRRIVLLHEMGGCLDSWDAVVPLLADSFTTLRYDQRGAGQSEKPRAPCSYDDHVDDLERVLAASGVTPPFGICGIAVGAAIAVAFAQRHPQAISALVLCSPALSVDAAQQRFVAERAETAKRDGMRAIVDASLARSYPEHLRGDLTKFDAYRAAFLANDPVCYAHANLMLAGADMEPALRDVTAPCLVLAGQHDLVRPPEQVRALASRVAGAEFAVIDSGHLTAVQAPTELAAALRTYCLGHTNVAAE
jgi:3-oxoadipate enol-lactonase